MRRLLPLLASIPLLACAPPQPPVAAQPEPVAAPAQQFADDAPDEVFADPERGRKLASAFGAIDAIAEGAVRDGGIPGLALGVVIDGRLVHVKGAGVVDLQTKVVPDADTVFRIGSLTKSFTGLAVLALRDEGALALDDPLARHLPEAAGLVYPTRDAPPITLRQVLTHTSGLPRLGDFSYTRADREPSEQEVLRSLSRFPLESAPGTESSYSNLGFALLGLVVERAAHMPLRAFLAKRVFAPLGMTSTTFDPSALPPGKVATGYQKNPLTGAITPASPWRMGASEGAGGIYSTVRDMARYVAFQLDAYPPRNAPETGPVRRSSVREAHFNALRYTRLTVRMRDNPAKGESRVVARAAAYGYGWANNESCDFEGRISHTGGIDGFASHVSFLPQAGAGVVVLANLLDSEVGPVAEKALLALAATGGLSPRVRKAVLPPAFEPALTRLLAVYNAWDLDAYKAMLSPERNAVPPEAERVELAGYKSFHGACKGWAPLALFSLRAAKVAMQCERGTLEMGVSIDTKGLIIGFEGTSRDVPPPPAVARAADRIAGLIRAWDDGVYTKILGANKAKTKAERQAFFDGLRASHGACVTTAKAFVRTNDNQSLALSCEKGGDLTLTLKLDDKDEDAVASFSITPASTGACPVQ